MSGEDSRRAERIFNLIAPVYTLFDRRIERGYRKAMAVLHESRALGPGMKALDIGTGTGVLANLLAEAGVDVTAVDLSSGMLAQAERKSGGRIRFLRSSAENLDLFEDKEFDLATAAFVLHGLERRGRRRALREMNRVAGQAVVLDYVPHRDLLTAAVERLEGSHYREFMAEFHLDLEDIFPAHVTTRIDATWGIYRCPCGR